MAWLGLRNQGVHQSKYIHVWGRLVRVVGGKSGEDMGVDCEGFMSSEAVVSILERLSIGR